MMDAVLSMPTYEFQEAQFPQPRRVNTFQPTRAKDGFIMIAAVKPNNFEALWRAIGHPEYASDPRFGSAKGRTENWTAMMSMLEEWAADKTAAECEAILTEGDVPCSRYLTMREALTQPHLAERGSFEVIDDGAGPLKVPNPAFKLRSSNVRAHNYVPALGADNANVLSGILGYSKDRIAALYDRKILHGVRIP